MPRNYKVKCNCKKCIIEHSIFCTCVMCLSKRINERGLLPSTVEYNAKVAVINKTISIKTIVYNLMKGILR